MNVLISDVINKEEVSNLVITELKDLGVKYRKEKPIKNKQDKLLRKRIFGSHLHLLELTDVLLTNGGAVQIPRFVSDTCERILEQADTEGLFRKAGSSLRQKEIRVNLESGYQLARTYHVIDVANVLKSFFRELPESILPTSLHEILLRSLLITDPEIRIQAILMSCLLLPRLTINTLAYFMQFLHTISLHSHFNKMSIDNLAIVFTPSLMPVPPEKVAGLRFNNHVKIVKILIEHSKMIGVIPDSIVQKLTLPLMPSPSLKGVPEVKKKKRRSGSLTRVFNGLRKIVGAIGSSENLDENLPEKKVEEEISEVLVTPCLSKSAKKRKLNNDYSAGLSAKKKKEILDFLPEGNGGLLPNTPHCIKEIKKSRLSLGGRKNLNKNTSSDKRWSIVGSNWSRKREKVSDLKKQIKRRMSNQFSSIISIPISESEIIENPNSIEKNLSDNEYGENNFTALNQSYVLNKNNSDDAVEDKVSSDLTISSTSSEYVRIPKGEYEAIKKRVQEIETRISKEFCNIRRSLCDSTETIETISLSSSSSIITTALSPTISFDNETCLSGPQRVLSKFEKTIEETENISIHSPSTDKLAKRLSRELKIRQSADHQVFRSPSQRKIGNIRRRSKESNVRLSRNKSWHVSTSLASSLNSSSTSINSGNDFILPDDGTLFQTKKSLKRGRPNTVKTGLQHIASPAVSTLKQKNSLPAVEIAKEKENWVAGELFFENQNGFIDESENESIGSAKISNGGVSIQIQSSTPKFVTRIAVNDNIKTPMLPPKSIPRRAVMSSVKTPRKCPTNKTMNIVPKKIFTTPVAEETQTGRASIARLRTQNAGMVLEKAKLFDGLGSSTEKENIKYPLKPSSIENRRKSTKFIMNKSRQLELISAEWECESKPILKHQQQQQKSKTPRKNTVITPKYPQQRKSRTHEVNDKSYIERNNLLGAFVNNGEITSRGERNKVTSIRNISTMNRNVNSPKRCTPKIKRNIGNSPRVAGKTAR